MGIWELRRKHFFGGHKLARKEKRFFSQNGEDGIHEAIFKKLEKAIDIMWSLVLKMETSVVHDI